MVTLYPQLSICISSGAEGTIWTRNFSSSCSLWSVAHGRERGDSKALTAFNSKNWEPNRIFRKSLFSGAPQICQQPWAGAEIAVTPPAHLAGRLAPHVPPSHPTLSMPPGFLQHRHIFLPLIGLSSFPILFLAFFWDPWSQFWGNTESATGFYLYSKYRQDRIGHPLPQPLLLLCVLGLSVAPPARFAPCWPGKQVISCLQWDSPFRGLNNSSES